MVAKRGENVCVLRLGHATPAASSCVGALAPRARPRRSTAQDRRASSPSATSTAAIDGFTAILKAAGLTDGNGKWTGGRTQLIQTGDYTDRGDGHARGARSADGARAAGQGRRRPRLRAARQSRGHEPDRRDARRDARDLRHLRRCQFRKAARRQAWEDYAKLAAAKTEKGEPVPAVYAQTSEAWLTTHPPGYVEYQEALSPARQVRRLAARQADRHRSRRQHLHARRHRAGERAREDRGPQRAACATRSGGSISSSSG